jgi:translocation and assembly module TamB
MNPAVAMCGCICQWGLIYDHSMQLASTMKWLLRGGLGVLLLLLLLVGLLWFAVATQAGLSRVLGVAQTRSAGSLEWQRATGSLIGPLTLEKVAWSQSTGQRVQVDSAALDWSPLALTQKRVELDSLVLDGVQIQLPAGSNEASVESERQAFALPDFSLPIEADVEQLLMTDIDIYPAGSSKPFHIDRIALRANAQRDSFQLIELQVDAPDGSLGLRGDLDTSGQWPTDLTFDWTYNDARLGPLQGSGTITGNVKTALELQHKIDGALQSGQRITLGQLLDAPQWQGDVDFAIADAGLLAPALQQVAVDLRFQTEGMIDGADLQAAVSGVSGKLNQYELVSQGEIKFAQNRLQLDEFSIGAGQSSLNLNGQIDDALDLQWALQVPQLDELLPTASGQISGTGRATGPVRQAQLMADIDVAELVFDTLEIGKLSATADIDVSEREASTLLVDATSLSAGGSHWREVGVRAEGMLARNQIDLSLDGEPASINAKLIGGLVVDEWRATLDELNIDNTILGDWTLLEPAAVNAAADRASVSDMCLVSTPTQICLNGNWAQADGAVLSSTVNRFEVARFAQWLPEQMQSEQFFNAYLVASQLPGDTPVAKINVQMPAAPLTYQADGQTITREMGLSTFVASLDDRRLDLDASIGLGVFGETQVQAVVADIIDDRSLDASIVGTLSDLSLVSTFAPSLQAVSGVVDIDVQLSGELEQPLPAGTLQLRDFSAEYPELALRIVDGELTVRPEASGVLDIVGQAASGQGQINISGTADPAAGKLQLNLQGEDFQVANSRNMRAVVSPDLDLSLDATGVSVRGDVEVPSAFFKSGGGRGAVRPSSDVVIVDDGREIATARNTTGVDLDVSVRLGEDIQVEAGDFDGSITGVLSIEQVPEGVLMGSGTIEVVNGDYLIYGQKLTMQRGRVLFGGGPLDDPELDLDVLRDVPAYEVKAGARVRGTAKAPLLELYSEPEYTDANILSFIVLGQPLGTKGGSYTLGKFITPDLYVSYGISLFGGDNTYNMRYKLNDRLTLQVVRTGENNSADLEYTLER